MPSRRGRGEGSIFERKDGTWAGVVDVSKSQGDGSGRKRMTVYGGTKRDVMEKLQALKARVGTGVLEPSKVSLAIFLDRWLEEGAKPTVKPNTYHSYADSVRLYISPYIGAIPLDRLAPIHVHQLMTSLTTAGKSARTQQKAYSTLRRAVNKALAWRLLSQNPLTGIDAPSHHKKAMLVLDAAQANAFLEAARGDRLYALYLLAVSGGLRQGELLGLQWSEVDLARGQVTVKHTLTEYKGRIEGLTSPKSRAGNRVISLPDMAVRALREHKAKLFGEGLAACPWVFPNSEGNPFLKSNFFRAFKKLLRSAKPALPPIRFHDLRHTCATLLLQADVPAKVVQERLGHSNIALTLGTYAHVLPSMQKDAAEKINGVLGGGAS